MQKVGDRLSKYDIVNEVFDVIGEIAKKSDFISAGLKGQDVYALCKQGYLERVKKGYYKLAVGDEPKEELILSKLMTHGVICVESALFYYGYSDFAPREWSIAVPRSYSRTVKAIQTEVPVKAYYVQNPMYHLGETTGTFNGEEITFAKEWSGHKFTDDELAKLLAGEEVSFAAKSKRGKDYTAVGKLAKQTYKGSTFYGFKLNPKPRK